MELSTAPVPPAQNALDYNQIAEWYNTRVEVGGALQLDPVYNITLFKNALARRGLLINEDFNASTRKVKNEKTGELETHTYVMKYTDTPMRKD